MPSVWLIGGTSESSAIAQLLTDNQIDSTVTVTTQSALALYPQSSWLKIVVGQIDSSQIDFFLAQHHIASIVDASHPYATAVSAMAIAAAHRAQIPYLRYERPSLKPLDNQHIIYLDNWSTLLEGDYLSAQRVLLTIGYKSLPLFKSWQQRATLFARILPTVNSLEASIKAGFTSDRLIALRPPVSLALEKALWNQWQISLVVTKANGTPGGEDLKISLATELGIPLIVVAKPPLAYPQQTSSLSEILTFVNQHLPQKKGKMSETITKEISDRICQHMNEDHGEAIVLYAKAFGNTPEAQSALMKSIDPQGMNLSVRVQQSDVPIRIEFDHILQDSEDAHHTLIAMVKLARTQLLKS